MGRDRIGRRHKPIVTQHDRAIRARQNLDVVRNASGQDLMEIMSAAAECLLRKRREIEISILVKQSFHPDDPYLPELRQNLEDVERKLRYSGAIKSAIQGFGQGDPIHDAVVDILDESARNEIAMIR